MAEVARKLREVPRASGKKRDDTRFSREPADFDGSLTAAAGALADLATQLRRKPRRQRKKTSETGDQFGFDPEFRAKVFPVFSFLYHHYWRVQVIGIRNVPR